MNSPQKKKKTPSELWKTFLPIPTLGVLVIGFGCSLSERTNPENLLAFPAHPHIAAPLQKNHKPASAPKALYAECAIAIDAKTGRTLFEKNADRRVAVASTQKLLAALVSLEEGPLDEPIPVSLEAAMMPPSKAYLRWMQKYSRKQLLEATLLESANDAALALSEAKNKILFIQKMNSKAKRFGAQNSNFTNPHGLDEPGQYSTARDLAKIAFHAYRIPFIRQTTAQVTSTLTLNNTPTTLKNTNRLVYGVTFNGLKSGFTHQAGKTLIASAKKGNREVILVLLNTTPESIDWEADRLWKWCLKLTP